MPMFPTLEIEEKVQISDKTRLNASKSFVSKGETAITTATITPGSGASAINIFNSDSSEWYSDFGWTSWGFDVDSTCNKIDFLEGSTNYVATISSATYSSVSALALAIQTAMNASGCSGVFTLTADEDDRILFGSTIQFSLLGLTGDNRHNGFLQHCSIDFDSDLAFSYHAPVIEYGLKKITLTVNNGSTPVTDVKYQKVYSVLGDSLFSVDSDLLPFEPDIYKWCPVSRSSFKDIHRKAQFMILDWLNGNGFRNSDSEEFTKFDLLKKNQVRQWSSLLVLSLIFEGISNAADDVFDKKAKKYSAKSLEARNKFLMIDLNADGKVDSDESLRLHVGELFRR